MKNLFELIWEFIKVVAYYLLPIVILICIVSQCH